MRASEVEQDSHFPMPSDRILEERDPRDLLPAGSRFAHGHVEHYPLGPAPQKFPDAHDRNPDHVWSENEPSCHLIGIKWVPGLESAQILRRSLGSRQRFLSASEPEF